MTELVLGLAWPVAFIIVILAPLLVHMLSGRGVATAAHRESARVEAMLSDVNRTHAELTKRIKALEDSQQHHATLLGRQHKGGPL